MIDQSKKGHIIANINEYFSPTIPTSYATLRVLCQHGYLFHGPPGTSKSSLSVAIAGLFGLDINVIQLKTALTEGDLIDPLNSVSRRSIILFKDIDASGLKRGDNNNTVTGKSSGKEKDETFDTVDIVELRIGSWFEVKEIFGITDYESRRLGESFIVVGRGSDFLGRISLSTVSRSTTSSPKLFNTSSLGASSSKPLRLPSLSRWLQRVLAISCLPMVILVQTPNLGVRVATYASGTIAGGTGYAVLRIPGAAGSYVPEQILQVLLLNAIPFL